MRAAMTFAAIVALAYGLLLVFVAAYQNRLLYLPDIAGPGLAATPADIGLPFEDVRFETSDGVTLHGWFVPARGARQVVLHTHGNGGNISHRLDLLQLLHGMGFSVLLFDYRGYGLSQGRPTEAGTYLDAEAAWRYLVEQRGYAPGDIILMGHSLGAAVAAHLAQHVKPRALILESPFTSVPDVAAHHYWFLPARWLSRFRYATVEYVRAVEAPVLVMHSPDDRIVPIELGHEVFRNAREPKAFCELTGGHNRSLFLDAEHYVGALRRFLTEHAAG